MRAGAHAGDAWRTRGRCVAWGRVRVGPPAGAHRVGGQALCGSGAWRAPLLTRAFSFHRPLREQGRAWTVEEGRQNTRGAWMVAAEEARGAEAKGPRRSARLDGDEGGARASDGDEGAVRAEERGEATDGGGRRSRKAVTEKAAAGIEWNGGTACKEKGLSPLPPF